MTVLTGRDRVRLEIGDTDTANALFSDNEIDTVLSERADDVFLTAADLCDILATRFAADIDFKWKDGDFKKGSRSAAYAARAKALRVRAANAGGGVVSVPVTRVDGYSDDRDSRDVLGASATDGHSRRGYTNPDLPV